MSNRGLLFQPVRLLANMDTWIYFLNYTYLKMIVSQKTQFLGLYKMLCYMNWWDLNHVKSIITDMVYYSMDLIVKYKPTNEP